MVADNESWLIETGDAVIGKKAESSYSSLSEIEKAIYCFWVIDYSIRNSGTLSEVESIFPRALDDLESFSESMALNELKMLLLLGKSESEFRDLYYEIFDSSCLQLRRKYEST